jgi:hypothetical protein
MFYLCQGLQCYGRGSTGRWLGGLPYLQEEKSQQNPRQSYEFITHHCRYQEPDVKFLQWGLSRSNASLHGKYLQRRKWSR